MQIHVVEKGQTIFNIANLYNVPTQKIIDANELEHPNDLVIGQAMVIPITGQFYFVQPGDSLYSIAKKFGIDYQKLAQINNIAPNTPLTVGLKLYIPPQPKTTAAFNGYIEPYGDKVSKTLEDAARKTAPYLTYLAPFSFRINRDGTLVDPPLNNFVQIANQNNGSIMMPITNLEEGEFSKELGRIIVTDKKFQDKFLKNVIAKAKELGISDVHFDFEFLPPDLRVQYNNFLRKAATQLHDAGLLISTALAPKTSATQKGGLVRST